MEKNTVLNQCVSGSVFQSQASHFTHSNSSRLTSLDSQARGGGGGRALHGWGPHQASEKKAEIERELGHIIFDVCGVPGTPKNTVLISHEHIDHIPVANVLADQYPDVSVFIPEDVFEGFYERYPAIPEQYIYHFRERLITCPTYSLYSLGDLRGCDDLLLMKLDHTLTSYAYLKDRILFLNECSQKFIEEHVESLVTSRKVKYIIMATPSSLHDVDRSFVQDFAHSCEKFGCTLILMATWLRISELMLSDDITRNYEVERGEVRRKIVLPHGLLVLPKIVTSYRDVYVGERFRVKRKAT